jgi:tripeptide aminopeptidase
MQHILEMLGSDHDLVQTAIDIQQIAAPTFQEQQRSDTVQQRFTDLGLHEVAQNDLGNVLAHRSGASDRPGILVSAHLDTVFPATADLATRRDGTRLYGPGIGDNSLGVAALLHLAQAFEHSSFANELPIWYGANVGEEGLGDLRGMRAMLDELGDRVERVVVIEGTGFGHVYHRGIAVRRLRIAVKAPGGHSWQDFGASSAIVSLVRIAQALTNITLPPQPKTTFNIGVIEGGTSVNTIAEHASLLLDMRSEDQQTLESLTQVVDTVVRGTALPADVALTIEVVGNREGGEIPVTHPLVRIAGQTLQAVGAAPSWGGGSTDANVPLSRGIPAVCVGITTGGNTHRLDEYIDVRDVERGMEALTRLVMRCASGESM